MNRSCLIRSTLHKSVRTQAPPLHKGTFGCVLHFLIVQIVLRETASLLSFVQGFCIFRWRHPGFFLKQLGKIMHRLEAKLFRDLGKTQRCIADHSLCRIYLHGDKVGDWTAAALLSEKLLQFRHA